MTNMVIRVSCEIEATNINQQEARVLSKEAEELCLLLLSILATKQVSVYDMRKRITTPVPIPTTCITPYPATVTTTRGT